MGESRPGTDGDMDERVESELLLYPHGFKVEVEVEVIDRRISTLLTTFSHWRRRSWNYLRGSLWLGGRPPRNDRTGLAAFLRRCGLPAGRRKRNGQSPLGGGRSSSVYGVGWRVDEETSRLHLQIWGVDRAHADHILRHLDIDPSQVRGLVAHRHEVYATLSKPDAYRLATSLGDGVAWTRGCKEVLLEHRVKVENGTMTLKLYRVDPRRGATTLFRLEAAWNGCRSRRTLMPEAEAQRACEAVLARVLVDHGITPEVKPSLWQPRGQFWRTYHPTRQICHERAAQDSAYTAMHNTPPDPDVEKVRSSLEDPVLADLRSITELFEESPGDVRWFGVPTPRAVPMEGWMQDGVLPEVEQTPAGSVIYVEVDPNQDLASVADQLAHRHPGAVWGHIGRQADMEATFRERVSDTTPVSPTNAPTWIVTVGPYTDPAALRSWVRNAQVVAAHEGHRVLLIGPYWSAADEVWAIPGGKVSSDLRIRVVMGPRRVSRVVVLNDRIHGRHGRKVWPPASATLAIESVHPSQAAAVTEADHRTRSGSVIPTKVLAEESRALALSRRPTTPVEPPESPAVPSDPPATTARPTGPAGATGRRPRPALPPRWGGSAPTPWTARPTQRLPDGFPAPVRWPGPSPPTPRAAGFEDQHPGPRRWCAAGTGIL